MLDQARRKVNKKIDFAEFYSDLCSRFGTCPQKFAKNFLEEGILNVNADRIKLEDWLPILETLNENRNLKCIAIRSFRKIDIDNFSTHKTSRRDLPSGLKRETVDKLCETLKQLLKTSKLLECLILEGIPLNSDNIKIICEGLSENHSVRYLSFEKCRLGDIKFNAICNSIKNSTVLSDINFSDCNLTWEAVRHLGYLIQHQSIMRHGDMWQKTLRYQQPDLETMGRLHHIRLNYNQGIGDRGVTALVASLLDDLWIKEIELQHCGLTDESGRKLLDLLNRNITLTSVDIRDNALQDYALCQEINAKLGTGMKTETNKWIQLFQRYERISRPPFAGKRPTISSHPGTVRNNKLKMGIQHFSRGKTKTSFQPPKRPSSLEATNKDVMALKAHLDDRLQEMAELKINYLKTVKEFQKVAEENVKLKASASVGVTNSDPLASVDDSVLTAIEATFKRFQEFIDLFKHSDVKNFVTPQPRSVVTEKGDYVNPSLQHTFPNTLCPSKAPAKKQPTEKPTGKQWTSLQRHLNTNGDNLPGTSERRDQNKKTAKVDASQLRMSGSGASTNSDASVATKSNSVSSSTSVDLANDNY